MKHAQERPDVTVFKHVGDAARHRAFTTSMSETIERVRKVCGTAPCAKVTLRTSCSLGHLSVRLAPLTAGDFRINDLRVAANRLSHTPAALPRFPLSDLHSAVSIGTTTDMIGNRVRRLNVPGSLTDVYTCWPLTRQGKASMIVMSGETGIALFS